MKSKDRHRHPYKHDPEKICVTQSTICVLLEDIGCLKRWKNISKRCHAITAVALIIGLILMISIMKQSFDLMNQRIRMLEVRIQHYESIPILPPGTPTGATDRTGIERRK